MCGREPLCPAAQGQRLSEAVLRERERAEAVEGVEVVGVKLQRPAGRRGRPACTRPRRRSRGRAARHRAQHWRRGWVAIQAVLRRRVAPEGAAEQERERCEERCRGSDEKTCSHLSRSGEGPPAGVGGPSSSQALRASHHSVMDVLVALVRRRDVREVDRNGKSFASTPSPSRLFGACGSAGRAARSGTIRSPRRTRAARCRRRRPRAGGRSGSRPGRRRARRAGPAADRAVGGMAMFSRSRSALRVAGEVEAGHAGQQDRDQVVAAGLVGVRRARG